MTNTNIIRLAVFGALALTLAFFLGRWTSPAPEVERIVETRRDTVILRDTHVVDRPVYVRRYTRDTILARVCDTIIKQDTAYIALPRETKIYEDSTYRAEVSGYQPSLDCIEIFQISREITSESVVIPKAKRWGIGVQVGAGMTLEKQPQLTPYIGVGVSYNLWTF